MGFMVLSQDLCTKLILFSVYWWIIKFQKRKLASLGILNLILLGGKTIGIHTIAVSWGFAPLEQLKEETPDTIVDSPLALLTHLS